MHFMVRAADKGLAVSKPWGDSRQYDFIVEYKGECSRVQVKSTTRGRFGGYNCVIGRPGREPYAANAFDYLAICVIPKNAWYIIPWEEADDQQSLLLATSGRGRYERYREAWGLLKGELDICGCAEESGGEAFAGERKFAGELAPVAAN
jgi:hypothetical protein